MVKEEITNATCKTCGMCCVAPYEQPVFADVEARDKKRLGRTFVRLNVLDDAIVTHRVSVNRGAYVGYEVTACVALAGDVGHEVRCGVYKNRPDVCRNAFEPGDRGCREVRADFQRRIDAR